VNYDYPLREFLQLSAFRSTDEANLNWRVRPGRERLFSLGFLEIHYRCGHSLTRLQRSPRIPRREPLRLAAGFDTTTYQRASRLLAPESAGRLIRERGGAKLREHP
jgi:hypothetical protein